MPAQADNIVPWDNEMCLAVALGVDDTTAILQRFGVTRQTYDAWCTHPLFMRTVAEYQQQARDSGLSFRLRARIQAESLLDVSYQLIYTKDVPAAVKADLIKWTAKMADLEPNAKNSDSEERTTQKALVTMLEKMSDGDLELRVMQVLSKKPATATIDNDTQELVRK